MSQKVLVIGGGPGGYTAAEKAAHEGADVTLFEKERLSGTCGIWGCIHTKTLYTTASAILVCDRLKRQGLTMEHTLDFSTLKARMNAVKDSTEKGVAHLMEQVTRQRVQLRVVSNHLIHPLLMSLQNLLH